MVARAVLVLCVLFCIAADPTAKQTDSLQQAYQRLRERQAGRAAAATQPANITQAQLDSLQEKLKALEKQVVELKQENQRLRAAMPAAANAPNASADKTDKSLLSKIKKGMSFKEVQDAIGYAPKTSMVNADGEKVCIWIRIDYQLPSKPASSIQAEQEQEFLMQSARAHPSEIIAVTFQNDKVTDFEDRQR
jgi:type II secretory pathway component PulM